MYRQKGSCRGFEAADELMYKSGLYSGGLLGLWAASGASCLGGFMEQRFRSMATIHFVRLTFFFMMRKRDVTENMESRDT